MCSPSGIETPHVSDRLCGRSGSSHPFVSRPAEVVWARLARLEEIQIWSEAVLDARCEGALSQGGGAERTCDLRGGITIRERWLSWDEGRSFTYEGLGIPLVDRARNEWTVQAEGDQTLLTSRAEVALKGGPLGRLLEPIIAMQLNRIAREHSRRSSTWWSTESRHP
jgi:Polyketide cyclase / dehydrase and lipid transport